MSHRTLIAVLAASILAVAMTQSATSAAVGPTFWAAGTWSTTIHAGNQMAHLKLVITQKGSSVSGTYGVGGSIEGLMHINSFQGRYKDSSGNGWVEFQFSQDGKSFVGNYGSTPGIIAGSWKGTKGSTSAHDTHVPSTMMASPSPGH